MCFLCIQMYPERLTLNLFFPFPSLSSLFLLSSSWMSCCCVRTVSTCRTPGQTTGSVTPVWVQPHLRTTDRSTASVDRTVLFVIVLVFLICERCRIFVRSGFFVCVCVHPAEPQSRPGVGQDERIWILAGQSPSEGGQPGGRTLLRPPAPEVSTAGGHHNNTRQHCSVCLSLGRKSLLDPQF